MGKNFMSNRTVTARILLLAGTAIALPSAALAQDAQPLPPAEAAVAAEGTAADNANEIVETGDIVVTARRRNEALLDVPIAVTTYSGAELDRQGAVDITDIADTTPNVTLEVSRDDQLVQIPLTVREETVDGQKIGRRPLPRARGRVPIPDRYRCPLPPARSRCPINAASASTAPPRSADPRATNASDI